MHNAQKVYGLYRWNSRYFTDTFSGQESSLKTFLSHTSQDVASFTDTAWKTPGKVPVETINLPETLAKASGRSVSDFIPFMDNMSKGSQKTLTEALSESDSSTKAQGKFLVENINESDTFTKSASKMESDFSFLSDGMGKSLAPKTLLENLTGYEGSPVLSGRVLQILFDHSSPMVFTTPLGMQGVLTTSVAIQASFTTSLPVLISFTVVVE
jgi:hypothetical protein